MVNAEDFNRWHNGKRLCRAPNCPNPPKWPKREYCSDECYNKFIDYYLQFHTWETAKSNTLKRDNYTCVICHYAAPRNNWGVESNHGLEVDHIIARSLIYHVHYMLNYRPVKPKIARQHKFWLQWCKELDRKTNALWNLRTLCKNCHSKKTGSDIRKLNLLRKTTKITDYWFYPTRKYKYHDTSKSFYPWSIFDDHLYLWYLDNKCDLDWTDKSKYLHNLSWTFAKKPWEFMGHWYFHYTHDEYLTFCIMFDVLENGKITMFEYIKPDPKPESQTTLTTFINN